MNALLLLAAAAFADDDGTRYFNRQIAPLLAKRCLMCHNQELKNGGVSFQDRQSLLKGGAHGPAVVPGNPDQSYLLRTLRHDDDVRMPPGIKLRQKEIDTLRDWIRRGAPFGDPPR